jgi:hypothetical protein
MSCEPRSELETARRALAQQAGICCSDRLFQLMIGAADEEEAAAWVRYHCGVSSRRELWPHSRAARRWRDIYAQYQMWRDHPELTGDRPWTI